MKRTDITDLFPEATKEQVDRIMDLNGADIGKIRGDMEALKVQLNNANTEIDRLKMQPAAAPDKELQDKLQAATDELTKLKASVAVRDVREKVSKATGVPADLLTGETEEACKVQAEGIKAYARPGGYPPVKDGGEVRPAGGAATRDQFAAWMDESFPTSRS